MEDFENSQKVMARALKQQEECLDEVKKMNQMVNWAKAISVRDQQVSVWIYIVTEFSWKKKREFRELRKKRKEELRGSWKRKGKRVFACTKSGKERERRSEGGVFKSFNNKYKKER